MATTLRYKKCGRCGFLNRVDSGDSSPRCADCRVALRIDVKRKAPDVILPRP